jgi:hypothetical protein
LDSSNKGPGITTFCSHLMRSCVTVSGGIHGIIPKIGIVFRTTFLHCIQHGATVYKCMNSIQAMIMPCATIRSVPSQFINQNMSISKLECTRSLNSLQPCKLRYFTVPTTQFRLLGCSHDSAMSPSTSS